VNRIVCDGKILRVQANLHKLLRELRQRPESHARYWIDAICINQQDLDERNQQILLMPKIYRTASRVIAWLGPCPRILNESSVMGSIHLPLRDAEYGSWTGLGRAIARWYALWRPFFTRVWMVQEILLAKQVTFLIGSHHFSPRELQAVFDFNYQMLPPSQANRLRYLRVPADGLLANRSRYRNRPRVWSVIDYLVSSVGRQATDPRDLVYAGLGLIQGRPPTDSKTEPIVTYPPQYTPSLLDRPDYSAEVREILIHCGIRLLQEEGLGALSFAYDGSPKGQLAQTDLPSWVPHFTDRSSRSLFMAGKRLAYAAGGPCKPKISVTPSGMLEFKSGGIVFAVIAKVFKNGVDEIEDALLEILSGDSVHYPETGEQIFVALARTIMADCFEGVRLGAKSATLLLIRYLKQRLAARIRKPDDDRRMLLPVHQGTPWKFKIFDQQYSLSNNETRKFSRILKLLQEVEERNVIRVDEVFDRKAPVKQTRRSSFPAINTPKIRDDNFLKNGTKDNEMPRERIESCVQAPRTFASKADLPSSTSDYWFVNAKPSEMVRHLYPLPDRYESELKTKLEDFALFKTVDGFLGIGSPHLKPTDCIIVPAGARVPYAARDPVIDNDTSRPGWQILGEVYVHGFMDGELVDSPRWAPESDPLSLRGVRLR
jgi:hypothetical protein